MGKNKEMKENLKKFREEAEKLEQSDALKKARAKYMTVEGEASVLKAKLGKVKETVTGVLEEATKSDIAKKAGKLGMLCLLFLYVCEVLMYILFFVLIR